MGVVNFANRLRLRGLPAALKEYAKCLSTGVKEEIAPLCEIKGVRARRAKLLYQAGFVSQESIAKADVRSS